jgi:hypothetical protein
MARLKLSFFATFCAGMDPIITSFANEELSFLLLFIVFNKILYLLGSNNKLSTIELLVFDGRRWFSPKSSLLSRLLIYGHENRLWCGYKSNYGSQI